MFIIWSFIAMIVSVFGFCLSVLDLPQDFFLELQTARGVGAVAFIMGVGFQIAIVLLMNDNITQLKRRVHETQLGKFRD